MDEFRSGGVRIDDEIVEAIEWLQCRQGGLFEDWGCGFTDPEGPWAKRLVKSMRYVGVDRNHGPGVDVVADLVHRTSDADAIFIHYVFGTTGYWRTILDNALRSFKMRMAVVESTIIASPDEIVAMIKAHARPFTVVPLVDETVKSIGSVLYRIER